MQNLLPVKCFSIAALLLVNTANYSAGAVDQYCNKQAGTRVQFINNCNKTVSIFMMAQKYGEVKGVPKCLSGMRDNGGKGIVYLKPDSAGYAFYQAGGPGDGGCSGPYNNPACSKTRFEITVQLRKPTIVSWDISANDGWDLPMTVVAPKNTRGPVLLIAKNSDAPGIYPIPANNPCAVQPCASNAWDNDAAKGTFQVYLCNRPEDPGNSPGKCGCKQCPAIACTRGDPNCATSGNNIYCKTLCPGEDAVCGAKNWADPPSECTTANCP